MHNLTVVFQQTEIHDKDPKADLYFTTTSAEKSTW